MVFRLQTSRARIVSGDSPLKAGVDVGGNIPDVILYRSVAVF